MKPWIAFLFAALTMAGLAQEGDANRNAVNLLTKQFGVPTTSEKLRFADGFVIKPTFSPEGELIKVVVSRPNSSGLGLPPPFISQSEYQQLLTSLAAVRSIGRFEEQQPFMFVSGGNQYRVLRFQNAYIDTREYSSVRSTDPRRIASVSVSYLHPVTGIVRLSGSNDDEDSFTGICIDGQRYNAPREAKAKLR